MSDVVEQGVDDLTLRINRGVCVGFAQCVDEYEDAFGIDDDGVVTFQSPPQVSRERLLRACEACPVEALQVFDGDGNQLAP